MGQLFRPRGLIKPGVKPTIPVEIDWSHPLAKGLVFYAIGLQDLVSGDIGAPVAAQSELNHGPDGFELESNSTSDGGFEWLNTNIRELDGSSFASVATIMAHDSAGTYGFFTCTPNDLSTWGNPYWHYGLVRNASTTSGYQQIVTGGAAKTAKTATGYLVIDGTNYLYSASKNDTTTGSYYRDGELFEDVVGESGFGNAMEVPLDAVFCMSRNSSASALGVNGRASLLAYWKRDLTAGDHAAFYSDPYALLKPRVPAIYYTAAGLVADDSVTITADATIGTTPGAVGNAAVAITTNAAMTTAAAASAAAAMAMTAGATVVTASGLVVDDSVAITADAVLASVADVAANGEIALALDIQAATAAIVDADAATSITSEALLAMIAAAVADATVPLAGGATIATIAEAEANGLVDITAAAAMTTVSEAVGAVDSVLTITADATLAVGPDAVFAGQIALVSDAALAVDLAAAFDSGLTITADMATAAASDLDAVAEIDLAAVATITEAAIAAAEGVVTLDVVAAIVATAPAATTPDFSISGTWRGEAAKDGSWAGQCSEAGSWSTWSITGKFK